MAYLKPLVAQPDRYVGDDPGRGFSGPIKWLSIVPAGVQPNNAIGVVPQQGANMRVTAGGPAPGQSAKTYVGQVALTGSPQVITLETVAAGKTFLITDIDVTTTSTTQLEVNIQAGATIIFRGYINATKGLELPGIGTQPNASAGVVVTFNVPAGSGNVDYSICGVEQ